MENREENMAGNDVVRQFMELLSQQDMGGQSKEFMEIFQYVAGMQLQLGVMLGELQGVREQLAQMQENQPKPVTERLMAQMVQLQEKIENLSERLMAVKDRLIETASQAVSAFKEKGKEGLCGAVQKGLSGVKSVLAAYQNKLFEVKADYEKAGSRINRIGEELKQVGNSVSNVGRLIAGKDTKDMTDEKPGVALTRMLDRSVKNTAAHLGQNIDRAGRALEKLDKLSERFTPVKETEKGGRTSLKDKLSQMKEKADRQNDRAQGSKRDRSVSEERT